MPQLPISKHPLIEKRNELLLQGIEKGVPWKILADQFNISKWRIAQIRREYLGSKHPQFVTLNKRAKAYLRRAWLRGDYLEEIAVELGVDVTTVKRWRRKLKLKPRKPGYKKRTLH